MGMVFDDSSSGSGAAGRPHGSHVDQVDAIMGFEGFDKTSDVAALDAAVQAGRITLQESTQFLILAARLTGARSVMKTIGPGDLRYAQIAKHYESNVNELRAIAQRCGPAVVKAFHLEPKP